MTNQPASQRLAEQGAACENPQEPSGQRMALFLLCLVVVLSLTTWFSATAVIPELKAAWGLSGSHLAWMTNAVQLGFVAGTFASSLVNLADVIKLNRLIAVSAFIAALANALLIFEPGTGWAIFARFITGVALAGVYPPALKLIATWFVKGRGLAMGAVIGALTLGSAMPHLFRAVVGGFDWQIVLIAASSASLISGLLAFVFCYEGPYPFGRAVFDPKQIGRTLRNKPLMLVTLGYLGHMWELYAMWAWFLVFVTAALELHNGAVTGQGSSVAAQASLITFCVIGIGGIIGCLLGGKLADRYGRTLVTAGMMIVSGSCAGLIGVAFVGPLWLLLVIGMIWGISVIGDSAQFSAGATELADQRYVGTALSLQMALGFMLSVFAVDIMPRVVGALDSWQWSFAVLMIGPFIGAAAMLILRQLPEAKKLAGGKR